MIPFLSMANVRRTLRRLPVRPHPALLQLQTDLFRSQVLKLVRGIRSPRRIVLSVIAAGLAVIWTAQTVLAILFREPAHPANLRQWIGLGMFAYALWHFLKAAFRPTEDPLEWTPAEIEWLHGSPLRRAELLGFRFASIFSAAALKAGCFCVVMIPDLHQPILALGAMLTGLVVIDLLRLTFDLFAWGLTAKTRWLLRAVAAGVVVGLLTQVTWRIQAASALPDGWFALGSSLLEETQQVLLTTHWRWAVAPFLSVATVTLAPHWTWPVVLAWGGLVGATGALALGVGWLDQAVVQRRRARERHRYADQRSNGIPGNPAPTLKVRGRSSTPTDTSADKEASNLVAGGASRPHGQPSLCRQAWGGAWLQLLGMRYYASSLTVSFLAPMALSLLPIAFPMEGIPIVMQVGGSLAFYSYVLLPTALKFDFRRNIDRMLILKRLPLRPLAVTLGQLATPVLSLTIFQAVVMGITAVCSDASWMSVAITLAVLAPANVFVIAMENLTFVYYPYRVHQEGVEIFLRSVLMFTAKGLAAGLALVATLGWSVACQWLATTSQLPIAQGCFLFGAMSAGIFASVGVIALLRRAYRRFDVTTDLPA